MKTAKTKSNLLGKAPQDNIDVVDKLTLSLHSTEYVHQNGKFINVKFNENINKKHLESAIKALSDYPQYIYSLDFAKCRLEDKGTKILIKEIITNKINILALNLDYNDITDESCPDIAHLITNTNIRDLSIMVTLFDCVKPCISPQAEDIMTPAILQSKTLDELNLSGHDLYRYSDVRDQIRRHLKTNKQLNRDSDKLEQLNETQLQIQLNELKIKLFEAEATIKELNDENNQLKVNNQKLDKTHEKLLKQNDNLKDELDKLYQMPEVKRQREESAAIKIQHAFRIFSVKNNEKKKEQIKGYVNNCLKEGDYETASILCGYLKEKAYYKAIELIEKNTKKSTCLDSNKCDIEKKLDRGNQP